jgi:hypothetical protein
MPKYHFASVLSKFHLFKIIPMYSSLKVRCKDFQLFILCMDSEVYDVFSKINFDNITLVKLEDIEDEDEEMLKAKSHRSFHEYCWTSKAVFLYYVLKKYPDAEYFAHLDADLYFYSNPEEIFNENPSASLYITHHRNSKMFESTYELTGIYNTGFVGCRNDRDALDAVKQWKTRCIKSCSVVPDTVNKTFGDQRYIEDWPINFKNVNVINSLGANAALWNIHNYTVTSRNGKVYLNEDPLIFYHFSGVSIFSPKEFDLCWYYHIDDPCMLNYIYLPYISILSEAIIQIQKYFPWFIYGFTTRELVPNYHYFRVI